MILDTSFLIDVLRGDESIRKLEEEVDEGGTGQVSPVTVMELWEGIHLADSTDREREAVKELLTGLYEAEFDTEAGKRAGEINADLKKRGEPIDVEDAMIAATALTHETEVVTGNPEHFERIPELDVKSY